MAFREGRVRRFQDIAVRLDYLASRSDVDNDRIAYLGQSWGVAYAPIVLAMEPRFKAWMVLAGGLGYDTPFAGSRSLSFRPTSARACADAEGGYDYTFPLESSQEPFFQLLGTKDKKHVVFDSAHGVQIGNRTEVIREELQWLDQYLGPVQR